MLKISRITILASVLFLFVLCLKAFSSETNQPNEGKAGKDSTTTESGSVTSNEKLLQEILENAQKYLQSIPPYACEIETISSQDNSNLQQNKIMGNSLLSLRKDGERIDLISKEYDMPNDVSAFAYEKRIIWDGNQLFECQQPQKGPTKGHIQAFVSKKEEKSKRILFEQDTGPFLEGRFWHNTQVGNWIDVFKKSEKIFLNNSKERINNYSCYVINASANSGTYKIWIDPESGYNIRFATIVVDNNNTAWGKPLGEQLAGKSSRSFSRIEMEISDVDIKEIDGHYFPVGGTLVTNLSYSDGSTIVMKRVVKRKNIQWNPDFDALGAFKINLPDGTLLTNIDTPGSKFEWQGGKLIPYHK